MLKRINLQFARLSKFRKRYNILRRFDNVDVLIDVGVFEGTSWLYQNINSRKLVLIDPELQHFDKSRFQLGSRECIEIESAVGRDNATGYLSWNSKEYARASISMKPTLSTEVKEVAIKSVSSILGVSNISRTDSIFLKVDVEGMELEVLRAFLEKDLNIRGLCVEIAANENRGESNLVNIINLCNEYGHKFMGISELRRNMAGDMTVADFIFGRVDAHK